MSLVFRKSSVRHAGNVWTVEKDGVMVGTITKSRNTTTDILPYQLFERTPEGVFNLLGSFYAEGDVADIIDSQPTETERQHVIETIRGGGLSAAKMYASRVWTVTV